MNRVKSFILIEMREKEKKLAEELLFKERKRLGIAKQLFMGKFANDLLFPYPQRNKDKKCENLLIKLKSFIEEKIDPDLIDRKAEIPQSVIRGLGELGILGMTIPKEFCGLGMSQADYCQAVEMIAARCGSTALFVNAHQSIGLKALLLFGTEEQKKKWLPPLAKGEMLAAFSLTEPNAGSDAAGIESRAVYDSKKKVYRINGKKQWTTNGAQAEVLTVMAKTVMESGDGVEEKISAFLVTPDLPGFKVTAESLEKVGMRGSQTANLEFCDMEVPEANLLGKKGDGLKICLTVLDYGRTTFGASCTGAAKFLLEKAISHAKSRYQFGKPLASFPLVKLKIAKMAAFIYAMEAMTYLVAGLVDRGIEDFMLESAILKVFCSEALWEIVYETMQIYGGRSFFNDAPFERMMRDARLNMIGEGANEVLRVFIGLVGMRDVGMQLKPLKEPFTHPKEFFSAVSYLMTRLKKPALRVSAIQFQKDATKLSKAVNRFSQAVVGILFKHGEDIVDKQCDVNRICEAVISLFGMSAVISRLNGEFPDQKHNLSSAKFYLALAERNVDKALNCLGDPFDKQIENVSDQLTGI